MKLALLEKYEREEQNISDDTDCVLLTRQEFDKLGEYSCSVPTGAVAGVQWKHNNNAFRKPRKDGVKREPDWWLREYVECVPYNEKNVCISSKKIIIV